jgi:hypothetical protein
VSASEIEVGDYVTLATARPSEFALTWKILAIQSEGSIYGDLYTLESGQTGRRAYANIDQITLYQKGPQ